MHPLNSNYFGNAVANSSIKVHYDCGGGTTTGWIVKQKNQTHFRVTSNGVTHYDLKLANSSTIANGQLAIYAYPYIVNAVSGTPEHVCRIDDSHIHTFEGNHYKWDFTANAVGYAQLDSN